MNQYSNQSSISDEIDDTYDLIRNETEIHAAYLNYTSKLSDTIELVVVCFGLVANLIGSMAMLRSRHMSTPSFVYHKALGIINFAYCMNFVLVKVLRQFATDHRFQYLDKLTFLHYPTAFYMGLVSRALASTCGYFVMYTSFWIIFDRFIALVVFVKYHKFNKIRVAIRLVMVSFLMSSLVHSWSPWIENHVEMAEIEIPTDEDTDSESNTSLVAVTVYSIAPHTANSALHTAISIKDMYNLVIRLTYAVAQTILTAFVVRAFHAQGRRHRKLKISPYRGGTKSVSTSGSRERSLSLLMLTVAFLSCTQVIPREFRRVFELAFPIDRTLITMYDQTLDMNVRRKYMYLAVYGHGYWKLIANILTAIERSILFYLYFILNHQFRTEVLSPFVKFKTWIRKEEVAEETERCLSRSTINTPSSKMSTNTVMSKTSTHTITSAVWMNRRLSSCVVILYNEGATHKNSKDMTFV